MQYCDKGTGAWRCRATNKLRSPGTFQWRERAYKANEWTTFLLNFRNPRFAPAGSFDSGPMSCVCTRARACMRVCSCTMFGNDQISTVRTAECDDSTAMRARGANYSDTRERIRPRAKPSGWIELYRRVGRG